MAHRKPLGTTCRMTLTMHPDDHAVVLVGDYLLSAACTLYLVAAVRLVKTRTSRRRYALELVRVDQVDDPDALVHEIYWHPRRRRTSAA